MRRPAWSKGVTCGRPHHRVGNCVECRLDSPPPARASRFVSWSGVAEGRERGRQFAVAGPARAQVHPAVPGATVAVPGARRRVDRACRPAARTAIPSWQRSGRRTRPAAARHRRASGRGRPRRVAVCPPSSISPHRQQTCPVTLSRSPAPAQALISLRSLSVLAIEILRGLARSAIGILSVSTPAS